MSTRKNSADLGTNGATVSVGNSGGTGINAFDIVNIGGTSAITYDNSRAAHGTQSFKFVPGSTEVTNLRWTGISSTGCACSFYVYFTALPAADFFLAAFNAGGPAVLRVMFSSSTGKLQLIDTRGTGGFIWRAAAAMPTSAWIRVEMFCTISATTASESVAYYTGDSTSAIDGTSISNGNTGTTPIDTIVFGKNDTSTYTTAHWFDSIQVNDAATGLIGPWAATPASTVRPVSLISNAGVFTNQGGASDLVAALADESDTTFAQSPVSPSAATAEWKLGPLSAGGNVTVAARHSSVSGTITRTYSLYCGATLIKQQSVVLPSTPTDWTMTTTSGETATITDRSDLHVRISDS
jgi:hypothetical protein